MTTVETIGRIRRAYFVQRQSVREIARRLHVSRKTVRKAIEAEDGKFSYDRTVQPMPKLGAHVAELERLLAENERKPRGGEGGRGWGGGTSASRGASG